MIDTSELKNKSYECLDDCAMCCLCQPEISEEELARFRKNDLAAGLTKEHVQGFITEQPTAIKLQGGNGACYFLKDRRCSIHEHRPAFCRQFPVHVHALNRIQLNGNLSCRGITQGGGSLEKFGQQLFNTIPKPTMEAFLSEVQEKVRNFETQAMDSQVYQPIEKLRGTVEMLLPYLSRDGGLGQLLAFADSEPVIGDMPPEEIIDMIKECDPPLDMELITSQGNYEQFELENPAWLPGYVDAKLNWSVYRSEDGQIVFYSLEPNGSLDKIEGFDLDSIGLMHPTVEARVVFTGYAALLNSRDQFLGYAYQVCADQDYAYDLMTVYLGLLATTLLDLWWRAGLIGNLLGKKELDKELAEEAIRAFDMDSLDMPSMGVFF